MTIYLDHNATTPVDPSVREEMLPLLGAVYGNPSSIHGPGQRARRVLDLARERAAALISARPEEIVFTSGGTESVHMAIRGAFPLGCTRGSRLIVSAVEHQAVLGAATRLEKRGADVVRLDVDRHGAVDPEQARAALTPGARLLSVMMANNDVGTVQPLAELGRLARRQGVPLHSDAVQALGKLPIDVDGLGVDLLSLSAHKIYGPKGVGALYIRKGSRIEPLLAGGHQESLRRAGTENLPGIAGFGKACQLAGERLHTDAAHLERLRAQLLAGLRAGIPGLRVNGHPQRHLPGTLNVSVPGTEGELLLMALDLQGVAASAGSACTADSHEPSHVLVAMGLSAEARAGALRLSLGRGNDSEQVDRAVRLICQEADRVGDGAARAWRGNPHQGANYA